MKLLYLVKHPKASLNNLQVEDIDRPLKGKGVREAYSLSAYLKAEKVDPQLILSSPANRCWHTSQIIARSLEYSMNRIQLSIDLYKGGKDQLLRTLTGLSDQYDSVMLVGHDPALTNLLNRYSREPYDKLSAGGVVGMKFRTEKWKNLPKSKGKLLFYQRPA
ncbi:MAG: histidine phosphatase family protein [Salibacteraceae bacterium]